METNKKHNPTVATHLTPLAIHCTVHPQIAQSEQGGLEAWQILDLDTLGCLQK